MSVSFGKNKSSSGPNKERQGQSRDIYNAAREATGQVWTPGTAGSGKVPPFDINRARDPNYMRQYQQQVAAAQGSKGSWSQGPTDGIPDSVKGAENYYNSGMGAGRVGLDALSGNADATKQLMNPYQQQVVDRMNEQFQYQNNQTMNQVNDAATRAGAFGGSRHGVTAGVALGENARNQGMQMAGLLQGGFDQTMNRAGQLAGYGMGAAGQGSNLGMTAGSPALWRMNVLKQGVAGQPYGTKSSGQQFGAQADFSKLAGLG